MEWVLEYWWFDDFVQITTTYETRLERNVDISAATPNSVSMYRMKNLRTVKSMMMVNEDVVAGTESANDENNGV